MKVLVTGGTGVVGEAIVHALHAHGHTVRVLTRHAGRDEKWWPEGVEGWPGDVSNDRSVEGAATGCDVIVHAAGIVEEQPPSITFQAVNIDGTRYVVMEAERAGVRKVIYVSSLGAERGSSAYHKSKYVAEDVVRTFTRDWLVVRPGAVYGPGDEHLSVLLQMMRTLPVIPTIGDGNQKFQPLWHEDFGEAVARAVERDDLRCQVLDVAGAELTSQNDLVARLRAITGRSVVQAPLPELFASWGVRALGAVGIDVNFNEAQMAMLAEGNVIPTGRPNGLTDLLGVAPTRLDDGLRRLVNEQPEQLPEDGVGPLTRKRYWVDISGSRFDHETLFEYIRTHLVELMPAFVRMKAEPHATTRIEEGETLTLGLPVRGNMQVRVAEVMDGRITLLTVAGHPIAGAVRFLVQHRPDGLRFEIEVYDRASSTFDELLLRTAGDWLQRATWMGLIQNVAGVAGGKSTDVRVMQEQLDAHEMNVVNEWAKTLAAQLSRKATSAGRD